MRLTPVFVCLFASTLLAQQWPHPPGPPGPGGSGGQLPEPQFNELKAAVDLQDAQITTLRDLQGQLRKAQQAVFEEMGQMQRALGEALRSATAADAAKLGEMLLDIDKLRKQVQEIRDRFDSQALAVLSADQRTKLKTLEEALKLQPAIQQAIGLRLLEPPPPPPGSPGRGPGG